MFVAILLAYFFVNIVVAILLHLDTIRHTNQRPKVIEAVVYFVVQIAVGLPVFFIILFVNAGRGATTKGSRGPI